MARHWRPSPAWALAAASLAAISILGFTSASPFIYFNF
jgi:hypothetical protein